VETLGGDHHVQRLMGPSGVVVIGPLLELALGRG
jgi:hypothetical protein